MRCSDATVSGLLRDPSLLEELLAVFESGDRKQMEHASECLEKVASQRPELLLPYAPVMLELMGRADSWLVKLHVIRILPRLRLTPRQRIEAFELMRGFLMERSSIVRTWAMQAMFELSLDAAALHEDVADVIDHALANGTAAMKARARHLRKQIDLAERKKPLRDTQAS